MIFQGPNMWSTPAVWKQYNKMAVLHFFLVNSTLMYILFSLLRTGRLPAIWAIFPLKVNPLNFESHKRKKTNTHLEITTPNIYLGFISVKPILFVINKSYFRSTIFRFFNTICLYSISKHLKQILNSFMFLFLVV